MAKDTPDPVNARKRIDEALVILKELGFSCAEQNDRSALLFAPARRD